MVSSVIAGKETTQILWLTTIAALRGNMRQTNEWCDQGNIETKEFQENLPQ